MKGTFTKTATVYFNDPEKSTFTMQIKGTIRRWIIIEPSEMVQLDGFAGEEVKKVLTIKTRDEAPFKIEKIDSTLGERVKANLKMVKENSVYELEITKVSSVNDTLVGAITLFTNLQKKPTVTINVKGTVRREVMVTPSMVNFGNVDASKGEILENYLRRIVIVERGRGEGFLIKKVKFNSDMFRSEIEAIQEGKKYKLTIILDKKNLKKGNFDEEMTIDTNYERAPILKVALKGNIL